MPLFAIVAALLLSACSGMHSYKYKVGVSQCVGGKWREKVNDEMLMATQRPGHGRESETNYTSVLNYIIRTLYDYPT